MNSASASAPLRDVQALRGRFAPVSLAVDLETLSAADRTALAKLIEAARVIDRIFLQQVWSKNLATLQALQADKSPGAEERLEYFWFNRGPWSDLDNHQAFIDGVPARKPLGAAFYPEDMSAGEFETWAKSLPVEKRRHAESFFTLITRRQNGTLQYVPYSEAYRNELTECGALLQEAARLTDNTTLRRFLKSRADAFASNDYYESDIAWMDMDAPLDITIGPYETYSDEIFGYKADFEAYIAVCDAAETERLKFFGDRMQELEDHLPIAPQYRNPKVGSQSPMRVVNLVFASGGGDHGVKAAAYNLPNDERVITQKGSKRIMLKNIQEAKFNSVLLPIAQTVLKPDALSAVKFHAFFEHILAHEMGHGIGPQQITVDERQSTPRQELKDLYSAIEEAKADILGLFILQYFGEQGYFQVDESALYTTYLASSFRTMRFGLNEAHGKGMAIQFNFLMDQGAFVRSAEGWSVDAAKMRDAVRALAAKVLTIEAEGDYAGARSLVDSLAIERDSVRETLARISSVPVDIDVHYVSATPGSQSPGAPVRS